MTLTKISLHCNLNPITPTVYKGFKHTLKIVAANIRVCLTILWIIRRSVINDLVIPLSESTRLFFTYNLIIGRS